MASAPDEHAVATARLGDTFVKARGSRAHFAAFEERGEEAFAIVRAADRTAEHHAGAVGAGCEINFGGANRFARRQPAKLITARPARRRAQGDEVGGRFAGENLAVARRLKKGERLESAFAAAYGVPGGANATTRRGNEAETGYDWGAGGHWAGRLASMKAASTRTDWKAGRPSSRSLITMP